ncbi:hypothetical protein BDY19DRAFT_997931 [Irpex rosettiformis]|uniref:Uncharacterized protein n=1 Tax=Irpex rosettiformis TaxID=378272 RepID=A0ACB8TQA0_9APHY|nr:hypothetical protein BDY19DRAFT_997931 [Irpex rosettiformis]
MGRWSNYDNDSDRLPDGMQRIGYDSDTRRYTFKDKQGAIWRGSPGAEFGGQLSQISGPTHPSKNDDEPIRLMPNAGPIPTPGGVGHARSSSAGSSKFSDFLPAGKLAAATPMDSKSSSPSPTSPTKVSKWNLIRSMSTPHAAPRMQSIVHSALNYSKSDSAKKAQYRPLDGRSPR